MRPVVALLEDLLLVGDFDAADRAGRGAGPRGRRRRDRSTARRQHAHHRDRPARRRPDDAAHRRPLATIDDAQFERVKAMCVSLGEVLVRPLAEALSAEERPRTRERLTAILIAFGAVGRREVERLKSSPEPGGAPDRDLPAARVRRQRGAARADRAARRQRAAGSARGGPRHPQHRHRRGLPVLEQALDQRHDQIARRDHAVARPGARRARGAAVRLHPAPRRSPRPAGARLPARDRSARRAARSRRASRRCRRRCTAASGGRRGAPRRCATPRRRRWRASAPPTRVDVLERRSRRAPRGVRAAARAHARPRPPAAAAGAGGEP